MRFLVIDDSMPMRRIIANVLARLGYTDVLLAGNGREALKRLETDRIDFVITDWFMPEMNGLDFVRSIRENDATKHVPILVVTGNGSRTDVAQAVQMRVNGYVLKPFTAELLRERIVSICASLPAAGEEARPAPAAGSQAGREGGPDAGRPANDVAARGNEAAAHLGADSLSQPAAAGARA